MLSYIVKGYKASLFNEIWNLFLHRINSGINYKFIINEALNEGISCDSRESSDGHSQHIMRNIGEIFSCCKIVEIVSISYKKIGFAHTGRRPTFEILAKIIITIMVNISLMLLILFPFQLLNLVEITHIYSFLLLERVQMTCGKISVTLNI